MNNKVFFIVAAILFEACSYGLYGNGNKSRDILLKPGLRWTMELETDYYLNGNKASEGRCVTYDPPGRGCRRFAFKKGVWRYWDPEGNLVWKEKYTFKKKDARSHSNMTVINEMPDSLENVLDSLFYLK